MLACTRIGAIHSVVLAVLPRVHWPRASKTPARVIVSADGGARGGKVVEYKPLLDEAIRLSSHKPERAAGRPGPGCYEYRSWADHSWGLCAKST